MAIWEDLLAVEVMEVGEEMVVAAMVEVIEKGGRGRKDSVACMYMALKCYVSEFDVLVFDFRLGIVRPSPPYVLIVVCHRM